MVRKITIGSTARGLAAIGLLVATLAVAPDTIAATSANPDPAQSGQNAAAPLVPPAPKPAKRPAPTTAPVKTVPIGKAKPAKLAPYVDTPAARAERLARIAAVKSWGYQLADLNVATATASPYDMLVVDATKGLADGGFTKEQVARLKVKPDGSRRLVISYLSIGEAEDYRPEYFTPEYLEEDAPDWLMKENPHWKGNRIIRFCKEGWKQTILGDEDGRSVYSSEAPSPLYKLLELGFDGVYLDRVDVYSEISNECPGGAPEMVDFVARLADHARKAKSDFIVILQNAEELLVHAKMISAIDAIAKEDLVYGSDYSQKRNDADQIRTTIQNLKLAKAAGRGVFVVDYVKDRDRISDALAKIRAEGFVPYIGPRDLAKLWLPGVNF